MSTELKPCPTKSQNLSAAMRGNRNATSHGHASAGAESPTWISWQAMLSRCKYIARDVGKKHAGRGIKVCDRWKDFKSFLADMGERPDGKTLDRWPNNDGDYEPSNCRWASPREQARNTRRNVLTFESAKEVALMRLRGTPCKVIAEAFGISVSLPREIAKGRLWVDALAAAKAEIEVSQ